MKFTKKDRNSLNVRVRWRSKTQVPKVVAKINQEQFAYVINDLTTPLTKIMTPLPPSTPSYVVKDYEGGGFAIGTKQSHSANAYTTITNVLNYHRKFVPNFISRWALVPTLRVLPEAGVDLNAFYNRQSLQFFFYGSKQINDVIYTSDSSDVVAHELGHAILDAYRPEAFNAASLEIWAMHEAFADWVAITNILSHDESIAYILNQTGGNLRIPNIASNIAEHIGKILAVLTNDNRDENCLRNAINNFKYADPDLLPKDAPDNQLAGECHSFGRLFLGVFYDMLVEIYNGELSKGNTPTKALQDAASGMAIRVNLALQNAPMNVRFSESVGKTLLWVENTRFNNEYYNKIRDILISRNIIDASVRALGLSKCESEDRIVRLQSTIRVKLGDHVIRSLSNNPLYDAEIEIPNEQVYLYDRNKNLMDTVLVSEEESLEQAKTAIEYLHKAGLVSNASTTPFEIKEGKLIRTHFS